MAEKIILHLTSRMDISEEEREIITYGFDSILSKGIGFLLPIPIVLYLGLWREYILFFILFGLLRPQAGGYHAETRVHCTVISFLLITVAVGGIRLWELSPDNGKAGLFGLILLMEMIIGLLAPVDTKNKRLTKEEKKISQEKGNQASAAFEFDFNGMYPDENHAVCICYGSSPLLPGSTSGRGRDKK